MVPIFAPKPRRRYCVSDTASQILRLRYCVSDTATQILRPLLQSLTPHALSATLHLRRCICDALSATLLLLRLDANRVRQLPHAGDVVARKGGELFRAAGDRLRAELQEPVARIRQGEDARHLFRHALADGKRGSGGREHAEPVVALVVHARLLETGD